MLDDRHGDAGGVRLLERVGPDQVRAHLPRDAHERRRVHPGVGDRRDEVRRTRAGGRHCNAHPPGGAREPLGHVPGTLLVPGQHVAHGRAARDRVVGGKDRPAGDPEHDVDALRLERAQDRVGPEHSRHLSSSLDVFTLTRRTFGCSYSAFSRVIDAPLPSRSGRLRRLRPREQHPPPSGGESGGSPRTSPAELQQLLGRNQRDACDRACANQSAQPRLRCQTRASDRGVRQRCQTLARGARSTCSWSCSSISQSCPKPRIASMIGSIAMPFWVRLYSTRGGDSG